MLGIEFDVANVRAERERVIKNRRPKIITPQHEAWKSLTKNQKKRMRKKMKKFTQTRLEKEHETRHKDDENNAKSSQKINGELEERKRDDLADLASRPTSNK